ncbi:MAG: hypothetical protein U0R64_04690 [Candidatus Nanopelagicales bacterium]
MDRSAIPQLWGLAPAPLSADLADEAEGLAAAELAEVGLADRLRGGTGRTVQVRTTAGPVAGRVIEVVRDAAQLATLDGSALVALPAVLTVAGLVGAARAPRGRERAGG